MGGGKTWAEHNKHVLVNSFKCHSAVLKIKYGNVIEILNKNKIYQGIHCGQGRYRHTYSFKVAKTNDWIPVTHNPHIKTISKPCNIDSHALSLAGYSQ